MQTRAIWLLSYRPGSEVLPRCGQEERQDRKGVLFDKTRRRPLTLHSRCANGHAWHMPLVIKPDTEPGVIAKRWRQSSRPVSGTRPHGELHGWHQA